MKRLIAWCGKWAKSLNSLKGSLGQEKQKDYPEIPHSSHEYAILRYAPVSKLAQDIHSKQIKCGFVMRFLVLLSIFSLCSGTTGCDKLSGFSGGGSGSAPIETSRSVYTATIEDGTVVLDIPHTFTNGTDDTVYIVNCRESFAIKLQKRVGGAWVDAVGLVIPQCLSPVIEVAEGESYSHTLQIRAGLPSSDMEPRFEVDRVDGVYRIVWIDVLESYNSGTYPFGEQIPLEQRVSNSFEIR